MMVLFRSLSLIGCLCISPLQVYSCHSSMYNPKMIPFQSQRALLWRFKGAVKNKAFQVSCKLPNFKRICVFLTDLSYTSLVSNFTEICPHRVALIKGNRRTDLRRVCVRACACVCACVYIYI